MKRLRRILTIVAMTLMASVSCYADKYCFGSSDRCPDGYECAPVGEIEGEYAEEHPEEPISATGDMMCYTGTGEGEPYYLIGGYLIDASNYTQEEIDILGNVGYKYEPTNVYAKTPLPLTDAILPLTLALGVYGWMIRRRQKKHRG